MNVLVGDAIVAANGGVVVSGMASTVNALMVLGDGYVGIGGEAGTGVGLAISATDGQVSGWAVADLS